MAASLFESQLYSGAFHTAEVGRLFSDSAEVRAMLLVEGALAKAQGALGIIPKDSAAAIQRAVMEVAIDPGALRAETASNGVPVPALVSAFRQEMNAPEHAQYVHWGATSQDIMDTALMLRLRQVLSHVEKKLLEILIHLEKLASDHADLPMAARSFGLHAAPTSFGAVVASWGTPLLTLLDELADLRSSSLLVSLSGSVGTGNTFGTAAADLRAEFAKGLALSDPGCSWHTDRTPILKLSDWLHRGTLALGKIGQDCLGMTQSGIQEIKIHAHGASSTLPHKQNPVSPAILVALARHSSTLLAGLQTGALHQFQRDPAAWFLEWLTLPQVALTAANACETALKIGENIVPSQDNLRAHIEGQSDLIHAEALVFLLAETLTRPEAQARVKQMCSEAAASSSSLQIVAQTHFPELDLTKAFDPKLNLGQAPQDARLFAQRIQDIATERPQPTIR